MWGQWLRITQPQIYFVSITLLIKCDKGLGTMMEEDAERSFGPEVNKVQSKPYLLIMTEPTAPRNSQQPWVPARALAGQHSSMDLGRSSQSLHKSLFTFSPSLPEYRETVLTSLRLASPRNTEFFYWVASISFCLPRVQELWMTYFLSLQTWFLRLYHISWQLLMPQFVWPCELEDF